MSTRRRLRVICSSDEEDDDDVIQVVPPPPQQQQQQQHDDFESETLNLQGVTLNSNPTNPVQIDISDEDFIDANEYLTPSPPIQQPPSVQSVNLSESSRTSSVSMSEVSDNPISRILEELGLRLRGEWLDSCIRGLETAVPGFLSLDNTRKAKLCFERFLESDMNNCGAGLLPDNVHQMHLVDLPGPFVLQVDEIVNIGQPLRERYKKANAGLKRCLKLSMTDGVQRVFGMEYQPIKDLEALAPAGMKVAISNVNIRRGLLMLVPEVFQVLGGLVEELDAARQRLVEEVNKPPRGRRTRSGVVPPLATRATLAAWPTDDINNSQPSSNPVPHSATPLQADNQVPLNVRVSSNSSVPINGRMSSNSSIPINGTASSNSAVPVSDKVSSSFPVPVHIEKVMHHPPRPEAEPSVSTHRENIEPVPFMATAESSANMPTENASFLVPNVRESVETTIPIHMEHVYVSDDEDAEMADAEENYALSSRNRESPFTYLASLLVKFSESKDNISQVEGKIKCFITGVKGFQFKQRTTYELHVYVDDGSLISEILIDHNVVQKSIGYAPNEVNAALSCSDPSRVQDMKNTMKQFQVYLVNFEGTMTVRLNEASSLPVATKMQQGCTQSDVWLLLRRLKSSNADKINLSL